MEMDSPKASSLSSASSSSPARSPDVSLSNHWVSVWHENEVAPFSGKPWTCEALTILTFDLMDTHEQDTIQRLQQIQKSIEAHPNSLDHHVICCALGNNVYWFDPNDTQQARVIGHNSQDIVDGRFPLFSGDREKLSMCCYESSWRNMFPSDKALQGLRKQLDQLRKWDSQASKQPLTDEERMTGVWYTGLYVASLVGGIQSRLFPSIHVLAFCSSLSVARARTNQLDVVKTEGKKSSHQDYKKPWGRIFENALQRLHDDNTIRASTATLRTLAQEIRWMWAPSIDETCLWIRDRRESSSSTTTPSLYFRNIQQLASCTENSAYLLPRFILDLPYHWTYAFLSAIHHCPVWNTYVHGQYYKLHGTTVCKRGLTTPSPINASGNKYDLIQSQSRIHERGDGGHITHQTKLTAIPRRVMADAHNNNNNNTIQASSLGSEGLPLPIRDEVLSTDLAYQYLCVHDGTKLADWTEFLAHLEGIDPQEKQQQQQQQQQMYQKHGVLLQHMQKRIRQAKDKYQRYAKPTISVEGLSDIQVWQHKDTVQSILQLHAMVWNVYNHGEWGAVVDPHFIDYYARRRESNSSLLHVCQDYPSIQGTLVTHQLRECLVRRLQAILWTSLRDQLVMERHGDSLFWTFLQPSDSLSSSSDDGHTNDDNDDTIKRAREDLERTRKAVTSELSPPRTLMTGSMIVFWPTWVDAVDLHLAETTGYRIEAVWRWTNTDWLWRYRKQGNQVFAHRERQVIEVQRQQIRQWMRKQATHGQCLFLPVFPDDMSVMSCTEHLHDFLSVIHNEWNDPMTANALRRLFLPSTLTLVYVRAFVAYWEKKQWYEASRLLKVIQMFMVTFQQQSIPQSVDQVHVCLQGCSGEEKETILDVCSVLHVVGLGMISALHQQMSTNMERSRKTLFSHEMRRSADENLETYQQWVEQMQKQQKDPPQEDQQSFNTKSAEQEDIEAREKKMLKNWNMMERTETEYAKTFRFVHSSDFLRTTNPPRYVEQHWLRCGQVYDKVKNSSSSQDDNIEEKSLSHLRDTYGDVYSHLHGLIQWIMLVWILPTQRFSMVTDDNNNIISDPTVQDILRHMPTRSEDDDDDDPTHIPWVFDGSSSVTTWPVDSVQSYQQHMKTESNSHLCRVFVEALSELSFSDLSASS